MVPQRGQSLPDNWDQLNCLSDKELIAIVAKCNDAITVLFDRYGRLIFRVAERILRDRGEAEDVLQTVLLDMFREAQKFDATRGSVKVWLLQYAYHRSLRRKQQLEARHFYEAEHFDSVVTEIVKPPLRGPLDLSTQETGRLVKEALDLINDRQRRTIELTYFEGLTADEIAARTGESVLVVRHNLYRGLGKLRAHLQSREAQESAPRREVQFRKGRVANARA